MRYMNVTTGQLLLLSLFTAVIAAVLTSAFSLYVELKKLPIVYKDPAGACIKVENRENGHAFNCNDLDVTLRRYELAK